MNLRSAALELTQLIFPPRCEVCNAFSPDPFCADCRAGLVPVGDDLCALCGVPFPPNTTHPSTCAACRGRERPWAFDSARAFGLHCGPLRRAVIRFKFDGRTQLAPVLAGFLAVAVSPLSPARQCPQGARAQGEGGRGGEDAVPSERGAGGGEAAFAG